MAKARRHRKLGQPKYKQSKNVNWLKTYENVLARREEGTDPYRVLKFGVHKNGMLYVSLINSNSRSACPLMGLGNFFFSIDGGETFPYNLYEMIHYFEKGTIEGES